VTNQEVEEINGHFDEVSQEIPFERFAFMQ
jgi:hypothetical protein